MSERRPAARSQTAVFNLTRCAVLSAMAYILFLIELPVVAFYKLDLSTMPAILAGFAMGPVQGFVVMAIKDLLHAIGSSTSGVGEIADLLMGCAFVIPASLIYRRNKTRKGALVAMSAGTVLMVIASVLVNYFVLIPAYQVVLGLPLEAIVEMGTKVWSFIDSPLKLVFFITAPFNLFKGVVLSGVTYLLYKRVSPLLHDKSGR